MPVAGLSCALAIASAAAGVLSALPVGKKSPSPSPSLPSTGTPSPSPDPSGSGSASDAIGAIFGFLISNPILPGMVIAWIAALYGWKKLTYRYNMEGRALPTLGSVVSRAFRLIAKEDRTFVVNRNETLAAKTEWLTWRRYWLAAIGLAVVSLAGLPRLLPDPIGIALSAAAAGLLLGGVAHVRAVFQRRHRILMQMFEVANAEMKYPKGAEMNPWAWVVISGWQDLYAPGTTTVVFPARFRGDDQRAREIFESNFNGTVSDQHTWTYQWETANNRVIASPVPFITTNAPYPFPDTHPWNEFPLGIAAGGKEAIVNVASFPHMLVAGTTGSGKALAVSTPIPTPGGWTTMGDIKPGDQVFDEGGVPCVVTWVSDVARQPDLYEVAFSDGTVVLADAEHLWWTQTRVAGGARSRAMQRAVAREALLSADAVSLLRAAADSASDADEITVAGIAALLGLPPDTKWLRREADRIGHVSENAVLVGAPPASERPAVRVAAGTRAGVEAGRWPAFRDARETAGVDPLGELAGWPEAQEAGVVLARPGWFRGQGPIVVRGYPKRAVLLAVAERGERAAGSLEPEGGVRTTTEILATLRAADGRPNHAVPVAGPLELPDADLPVDPFALGASVAGSRGSAPGGLIPAAYLRASAAQRRALLAGLSGAGRLAGVSRALAGQVLELACSLGCQATMRREDGSGERWVVEWSGDGPRPGQPRGVSAARDRVRLIVSVRPVLSEPARCIAVDSPSRLFLCSRAMVPTHNSVTQRTLLLHALQHDFRVVLIDPKRVELTAYRDHPNVAEIATELHEEVALIERVEQEMQARYAVMQQEGVNHFKRLKDAPPPMLVMVDELFALLSPENIKSEEGKERDELHARAQLLIASIARLGRAAGVHMILATQRPDAKILGGETKALAVGTEIATPSGWTTIERLAVGDTVFDSQGRPCRVVGATSVMHDHACLEVSLSDGSSIVADAGHLWAVDVGWTHWPVVTTERLQHLVEVGIDVRIPVAGPLLPGCWPTDADYRRGVLDAAGPAARVASREEADALAEAAVTLGLVAQVQPDEDGWLVTWSPERWRTVTSVTSVPSVPVRCIAVDSPSRLFLAGRSLVLTHNSNLDVRIAQGRMDTTPSLMVMDSDHATRIPPVKGRAMVRLGGEVTEFQAYFLPEEHLEKVLKMSAAIAQGVISAQELMDAVQDAQSPAPKRRLSVPLPSGLRSAVAGWVERRNAVVASNEAASAAFAAGRAARSAGGGSVAETREGPRDDGSSMPRGELASGSSRGGEPAGIHDDDLLDDDLLDDDLLDDDLLDELFGEDFPEDPDGSLLEDAVAAWTPPARLDAEAVRPADGTRKPEPVAAEPVPVVAEPEPVAAEPEPVAAEPVALPEADFDDDDDDFDLATAPWMPQVPLPDRPLGPSPFGVPHRPSGVPSRPPAGDAWEPR